jgi:MerR family transcriptional regulator, light-induced transcriptional regulator
LSDNRDAAVYNIKAVSRLTGVAPDTLRRWESRYHILSPQRSAGGYRMYSQGDVDTIRWLRARVDEGLSISRACELLRTRENSGAPSAGAGGAAPTGPAIRSLAALTNEVLDHLGRMEEAPAAQLMSEALGLYTVEQVVADLTQPALVEIGDRWMRGDWTVAQEHFASAFFRGRLANLLHASPFNINGPLVIVACAPEELHEIGAQIMALYLRRAGFRVVYLGQNVPLDSLVSMARALRPAAICCSASRPDTAGALRPLAGMLADMERQAGYHPVLAFGGAVFNRHPDLAGQMNAAYLGASPDEAVASVRRLIA